MIDEKKLLCAFIYSAYESGYCGLMLDSDPKKCAQIREDHKRRYKSYIKNRRIYPEDEINSTQKKMMDSISHSGVRDYIYGSHFEVVRSRIEEETKINFKDIKNTPILLMPAISCSINYYKVLSVKGGLVSVENILLQRTGTNELKILKGLEKPVIGDIVSGHWDYMLEVVTNWKDLERYTEIARRYYNFIIGK